MKTFIATFILVCACAASAQTSNRSCSAPDDRALRQIAEEFKDAYNLGNAARAAALYTEDAYYFTQHFATGIVQGRPAIQAYIQRGVDAKYKITSIRVLATDCGKDFAYALTRYESDNAGQKAFGLNIVVVKKIGGKWMIVAHESAVPEPTAIKSLDIPKTK